MPEAEIDVDADVLRHLVDRQFPAFRDRAIVVVDHGWDNVVARLGADLAIRVPRRAAAVPLLANEVRWLPTLAPGLPVEVPIPEVVGAPEGVVPWPWTIVRWVAGEPADLTRGPGPDDAARMVRFLRALAHPAPGEAPANPFRGVDLARRDEHVRRNLRRIADRSVADAARRLWDEALSAPVHVGSPVWVHGDLHPANLVTREGRLTGVIDWGDLCAGDPAVDLQIAWTWFDHPGRQRLWTELGPDLRTVARARGNALAHAVAVVANSADNPRMAAVGARTLRSVLDDPDR